MNIIILYLSFVTIAKFILSFIFDKKNSTTDKELIKDISTNKIQDLLYLPNDYKELFGV